MLEFKSLLTDSIFSAKKIQISASTSFFYKSEFYKKNWVTHTWNIKNNFWNSAAYRNFVLHTWWSRLGSFFGTFLRMPTVWFFAKKNCLQLHPITPFSCKIQGMNGIPFLCNKTVIVLTLQRKNAFKSSLLKSIPFFPLFLN